MYFLQNVISQIEVFPPDTGSLVALFLAIFLLMVSAYASGSEIAFFSLSPTDVNSLDPERNAADRKIITMRDESERTLATILVLNNLVNVTIIMLLNYFFGHVVSFGLVWWMEFLCITVLLTFLLLLFGEIIPKVYAGRNALSCCRFGVSGLLFCRRLFYPVASLLMLTGRFTDRAVGSKRTVLSVDELEQALELTDTDDIRDEKNMLEGIVRFGDETAKEIMTSRQDVVTLDISSSFSEVINSVVENNYSRIPVYQDSIDNIRGILYIKDLLPHLGKPDSFRWRTLIRPPYFVPETKMIDDLLREFQANKVHIAVVVDEYGGTSGIVTLEDILEEIVGEINDEYDEEEKNYVRINKNTYVFEGKTLLSDLYKILDIDDDTFADVEGDADTLAGLLLELKGDFPKLHERLEYSNFTFEVMEIEERRLSKIKIILPLARI